MSTWYWTTKYRVGVLRVEVEKFTDKTVWIEGSRRSRRGSYDNYFPTRAEAFEHKRSRLKAAVDGAERNVRNARIELNNLNADEARQEKI